MIILDFSILLNDFIEEYDFAFSSSINILDTGICEKTGIYLTCGWLVNCSEQMLRNRYLGEDTCFGGTHVNPNQSLALFPCYNCWCMQYFEVRGW